MNSPFIIQRLNLHPDPAELRVRRLRVLLVLFAQDGNLIILDRVAFRFHVHPVKARGVQAEDLSFDFGGEFLVAVLVGYLVAYLESAEALYLALRAASPYRI